MTAIEPALSFEQIHIDVARHASDDFNPFHDPQRWGQIRDNPFNGPIALGFQLEFLIADRIYRQRRSNGEAELIEAHGLYFSNYEFRFAGALRSGETFRLEVKDTLDKTARGGGLSNRLMVRKHTGDAVLLGSQSETPTPRFLTEVDLSHLPSLQHLPDRITAPGTPYFLKRKFLNTSNGKNFALAALSDPHNYFDEPAERVYFPPLFTAALLSSALMEKGRSEGYDLNADPLVYTSHRISIDRRLQSTLRSNDCLHLLVEGPLEAQPGKGLGRSAVEQQLYRCFGLIHGKQILFRANVELAPLHAFLNQTEHLKPTAKARPRPPAPAHRPSIGAR